MAAFVKFERGTPAVYASLAAKKKLNEDTLYFIYDKDNPSEGGLLYLGYTLIGGTGSAIGAQKLDDLSDVKIAGLSLADGMILQYNAIRSQWQPISLTAAINNANISNANVEVLTSADNQTIADVLAGINAKESDIAIVDGEPHVYDGTQWVSLTSSSVLNRLDSLESRINTLESSLISTINQKIADANHLTYEVLTAGKTLDDVDTDSPNINNTVYLVPKGDGTSTRDGYDEYMYVNGEFERLGSLNSVNLDNYVTQNTFDSRISEIQSSISSLSNTYVTTSTFNSVVGSNISALRTVTGKPSVTVIEAVKDLYDRLTWVDMTDSD